ncbi:hypothetical protein [Pseudomonas sp. MUP55]|uniref:hypothetical protein n=1 Tax=Pseudomonas sp. MUP55 TaxID=3087234 RepID=UPI002A5A5A64|nr:MULTISPECIES: hypothetical protein [unclassified Pseudomonas]WPN90673.1 hypothetical protein SC319_15540 [Pseudomonas sp. MUP56]WPN96198.1 hypothetical protein SC318_15545 [Pseudomonas sp. MUP55]
MSDLLLVDAQEIAAWRQKFQFPGSAIAWENSLASSAAKARPSWRAAEASNRVALGLGIAKFAVLDNLMNQNLGK